jgi:hypothetical protein
MAYLDVSALHRPRATADLPQQLKPPRIGQRLRDQMNLLLAQRD